MRYWLAALLAGCATADRLGGTDAAPGNMTPHDAAAAIDGADNVVHPMPDSGTSLTEPTVALLLTEVSLGPSGHEFIELLNPTTSTVDLSMYYLSDNGNYFTLPAGTPAISSGDFVIKFPTGSKVDGHGVVTVALGTSADFQTAFGAAPTFSLGDGDMTTVVAMNPTLTDAGEIVVLFAWDGLAPLVKDVDMLLAGVPTAANGLVSKSGYTQGTGTYATDADTIPPQASAPAAGKSTKRIALAIGHETQDGTGNGITGDDETSEQTTATWDTTATFSAPTPGTVPDALLQ